MPNNNTKSKRPKQILYLTISALLVIAFVAVFYLTQKASDSVAENPQSATENITENTESAGVSKFAEELAALKNPYLGDMPANGKIISKIFEVFEISGSNATELQTTEEPYWITMHFKEKPDEKLLWKAAGIFLALVDNCSEFRWEYTENGMLYTYYVRAEDFDALLAEGNIKKYGESSEMMQKLLNFMEVEESTVQDFLLGFLRKKY